MRADELTLVHGEPGAFSFSAWRNVTLNVWSSNATAPALRRLTMITRKMMAEYPGGFSAIHIVQESAGLPDAEARSGFVRLTNECVNELACVAVIIGGTGFWASALRAAITGIWQALPKGFDMRICGTSQEVADWLPERHARRTGAQLEPDKLNTVIRQAVAQASPNAPVRRSA